MRRVLRTHDAFFMEADQEKRQEPDSPATSHESREVEAYEPLLVWLKGHEDKYPVKTLNFVATLAAVVVAGMVGFRQVEIMDDQAKTGREQNALQSRQQLAQEKQDAFLRDLMFRPAIQCFYSVGDGGVAVSNRSQHGVDLVSFTVGNSPPLEPGVLGGIMHLAPQGTVGQGYSILYLKDLEKIMEEQGLPFGKSRGLLYKILLRSADQSEWELGIIVMKMELDGKPQFKVQQQGLVLLTKEGN
jgi:hypothetical protein